MSVANIASLAVAREIIHVNKQKTASRIFLPNRFFECPCRPEYRARGLRNAHPGLSLGGYREMGGGGGTGGLLFTP